MHFKPHSSGQAAIIGALYQPVTSIIIPGLVYLFIRSLYGLYLTPSIVLFVLATYDTADIVGTLILASFLLIGFILLINHYFDLAIADSWFPSFRPTRSSRYDLTNMRARHRRRLLLYLEDPLSSSAGVHILPPSALREKNTSLCRSRYKCHVRVEGVLILAILAFARLPSSLSPSAQPRRYSEGTSATSFFQNTAVTAASVLLAHANSVPVLVGGGDSLSSNSNIDMTVPDFVLPSDEAASNPVRRVPEGVLDLLLPDSTSMVIHGATNFADRLPALSVTPIYSHEPPNLLIHPDSASADFRDDLQMLAPDLLHSAIHDSRRLSSQFAEQHRSGARSLEFAPNLRVPLWTERLLQDTRLRATNLFRWGQALDFLEPYLAEGFEGVTQTNQHLVAEDVRNRLHHTPLDQSLRRSDGSELLSPQELAAFLSRRWLNDSMINAGLDWMIRELGPTSTVGFAHCLFLESLRHARVRSGDSVYHSRLPSALAEGVANGRIRILEIPVNAGGVHWAGIRVDIGHRTYSYRDGLNDMATVDPADIALVEWYLSSLLPDTDTLHLAPAPLPIVSPKQTDTHSCGVVYLSSLLHEHCEGPAWHQELADMRRMEWFLAMTDGSIGSTTEFHAPHDEDGADSTLGLEDVDLYLDDASPDSSTFSDNGTSSGSSSVGSVPPSSSLSSVVSATPAAPSIRPGSTLDSFLAQMATPSNLRSQPPRTRRKASSTCSTPQSTGRTHELKSVPLTSWFKRMTPEEAEQVRLASRAERMEAEAERCRLEQQKIELRKIEKKAAERAKTRERVRAYRRRQKQRKDAQQSGNNLSDVLGKTGAPVPSPVPASTAERSRPLRAFNIDLCASNASCGRKRLHEDKAAKTTNWTNALLFEQIKQAAYESGPRMRVSEILKILQRRNPTDFATLTPQVLGRYIERPPNALPYFKASVLKRVARKGGAKPGGQNTRSGFLDGHPSLITAIVEQLTTLRAAGVPVSVHIARGIMLAHIRHLAPELLERTAPDGSRFKCSDAFKIPADANQRLFELFVRLVLIFRDAGIRHGELFVNFDQTQVVVADPSHGTYEVEGSKQVSAIGVEEKRAWTAVVGVASSGSVLPFQVVMKGKTDRSLPSEDAPSRSEARDLGFQFNVNEKNYWSSLPLMERYFETIVVPYFTEQKTRLGYSDNQECVVLLDCWSVHRSKDFRDLVRTRWPWIRLRYVPGGMTGLAQPCDVGIQRPFKLSIKRSQLDDIVAEILAHLNGGADPTQLHLDTHIGTLRNRSVSWFVRAWQEINQPELVRKAFQRCVVRGGFNLSFESITSSAALKLVRKLPRTDPETWAKVIADYGVEDAAGNDGGESECELDFSESWERADGGEEDDEGVDSDGSSDFGDDTALGPVDLMRVLVGDASRTTTRLGDAERLDVLDPPVVEEEELGRGKRRKTGNKLYNDFIFDRSSM
ncbi:unnamed protein product [Peniophora sp. CBMAI 1063]|nr:unnamed protein product [Peniophora sp. CBMAI 1063]